MPVNPGVGLTPEREGWAPGRVGIPGMEMLLESGKAGEPRRPAPFPHPWGCPRVWQPSEMTGPGAERPGRAERPRRAETPERAERPGRAETPERAQTPEGAESFTVRGCRADVPGLASVTRKGR